MQSRNLTEFGMIHVPRKRKVAFFDRIIMELLQHVAHEYAAPAGLAQRPLDDLLDRAGPEMPHSNSYADNDGIIPLPPS